MTVLWLHAHAHEDGPYLDNPVVIVRNGQGLVGIDVCRFWSLGREIRLHIFAQHAPNRELIEIHLGPVVLAHGRKEFVATSEVERHFTNEGFRLVLMKFDQEATIKQLGTIQGHTQTVGFFSQRLGSSGRAEG